MRVEDILSGGSEKSSKFALSGGKFALSGCNLGCPGGQLMLVRGGGVKPVVRGAKSPFVRGVNHWKSFYPPPPPHIQIFSGKAQYS